MNKKIFNFQIWLIVLVLLSIWIIMSVGLGIFPLLSSNFSELLASKLNQVLLNISYSIIAAYIFFLITYLLPRKILIYRSKKILSQQVHWLLYELFVLINQILYAYDLNKTIEQIEEKDLRHIDGNIAKTIKGFYKTGEHWQQFWKRGKKLTGFANMPFIFPEDTYKKLSQIPELIKKIRLTNPNFYVDETFAEILSSIETNKIIEWYLPGKQQIFKFSGSSTQMYNLIYDYKRLLNLKYHKLFRNIYQSIHFYTPSEIDAIPDNTNIFFNKIAPKQKASRSLFPSIVYNFKYYDYRTIVAELNEGAIATQSGLQKEFLISEYVNKILTPNNSRCIVIICDLIPKNEIKEFIKSNQNEKVIILLKSSLLFKTRNFKFKDKSTSFGLYEIFYRKPLNIFSFHFFKKYPTREMISHIRFNVTAIMRNFKEMK